MQFKHKIIYLHYNYKCGDLVKQSKPKSNYIPLEYFFIFVRSHTLRSLYNSLYTLRRHERFDANASQLLTPPLLIYSKVTWLHGYNGMVRRQICDHLLWCNYRHAYLLMVALLVPYHWYTDKNRMYSHMSDSYCMCFYWNPRTHLDLIINNKQLNERI